MADLRGLASVAATALAASGAALGLASLQRVGPFHGAAAAWNGTTASALLGLAAVAAGAWSLRRRAPGRPWAWLGLALGAVVLLPGAGAWLLLAFLWAGGPAH